MNLKDHIDATILLRNNTPLDDFSGLTPNEIHQLLYKPFANHSVVQLRTEISDDTLDLVPFFRIAEAYLKIIQRDKFIKLTPLGALPKKPIVELYAHGFLPDELIENRIIKLWKQEDCISLQAARFVCELGRLVKKAGGKISLTKKATKLLQPENRQQLFKEIFEVFVNDFQWSYNDGYTEKTVGQFGWAFSVYLLNKFGNEERIVQFYAAKYLKAFPDFLPYFHSLYGTPQSAFMGCYGVRTFERFLVWFGFVPLKIEKVFIESDKKKYKATALLKSVFSFE